ncbi:ArnT family glycosyltransferase [Hyphobacterium sp.]|uniref:ArnT family glycosyltransferase n=1 Tax=Hyphobacterium sp. TaxID=2004662 RepID=UPI003B518F53
MADFISGPRAWWILAALAAIAALAGVFTVQPLDRDESRYAQATAQMLETGDFIDIRFQDDARHKKPVGIYWMQAVTVGLLSDATDREIWAYRLPSVIGAILAVLGCFWAGTRLMNREAAFVGAAMLAVSSLLAAEAGIAKTDAMLAGLTTLAMAALVQLRHGGGKRAALVFWAMLGLGILVKGPVTPMIAGLAIIALVAWERRIEWLKPLLFWPGPVMAALIVLPWIISIEIATGGNFLFGAFLDDLAPKLSSGDEGHGGWPGYHLLLLPVLSIPFGFFLLPGLHRAAAWLGTEERAQAVRFLIAWIAPAWIVFELMPTKLPHYPLPLYAALALIAGLGWEYYRAAPAWSRWGSLAFGLAGAAGFAALLVFGPATYGGEPFVGMMSAAIFGVAIVGVAIELLRIRAHAALALALFASISGHYLLRGVVIPATPDLDLSQRVAGVARDMAAGHGVRDMPVYSSYTEPSLVFALGTDTRLLAIDALVEAIAEAGDVVVSIEDSARSGDDPLALARLDAQVCAREEVAGYNYSRGERTVLIVRLHNCEQGS